MDFVITAAKRAFPWLWLPALLLLAGARSVMKHNLTAKARIVASATSSLHPDYFPDAPVAAIQAVCARAGLKVEDIDLFEINEAFASVPLIAIKNLQLDSAKVNVNGGACAIGHPVGASGARLALTVVRELHKRNLRYGLATLCIGGGEAVAVIFERRLPRAGIVGHSGHAFVGGSRLSVPRLGRFTSSLHHCPAHGRERAGAQ